MTTVLVVDDDVGVGTAVTYVLEGASYQVALAASAEAARDRLSQGGIDACVLDVFLDGDDGLTLADEVVRAGGLPLIVMSGGGPGRTLESVAARADALGAAAVLFKPFDDDELLGALRRALGEAS